MIEPEWKTRLRVEVARAAIRGVSMRQVSERAGLGPNYVSQMLSDPKTPTLEKFLQVCAALGASPVHILTGLRVTPEMEELLKTLQDAQEDVLAAVLTLVHTRNSEDA